MKNAVINKKKQPPRLQLQLVIIFRHTLKCLPSTHVKSAPMGSNTQE